MQTSIVRLVFGAAALAASSILGGACDRGAGPTVTQSLVQPVTTSAGTGQGEAPPAPPAPRSPPPVVVTADPRTVTPSHPENVRPSGN
jgi:hypothetical protein